MVKKIGILGGTFDPPHIGHLMIAEQVRVSCKLDEVWFMPNQTPPHKRYDEVISNEHRVEMVKRSIENNPYFHLSLIECERKDVSYTYDTMKILTSNYPNVAFYFIIGGDMVEYLPKWYRIDDLLNIVTFIGAKRPGYKMNTRYKNRVIEVEVAQVDISSSLIRQYVKEKKSIRYLVTEKVREYIEEMGLYG